jgi:LuxR family transcriptional regulator, maltose regulon positive regulatory protein
MGVMVAVDTGRFQPIGARLRPERAQVPTVARETLLDRLVSSEEPLLLVSAPAGYGKTTLLRQWVERDARPAAWLQLEPLHDDPVALLCYLVDALGEVAPVDPGTRGLLSLRDAPIEERVLPGLSAVVEAAPPFLLVLDDAHHLTSSACWRYVGVLLDALQKGGRLTIASRTDPPIALARLRAMGRLSEIRLGDLRMTRDETAELLRLHQRDTNDDALDALLAGTEGWATGIYLAILAGASPAVAAPHGDLRQIAAYLTAEVLDRLPSDLQEFLLLTSVLDRLSADLCREVTGRSNAHELLERLTRENLFVTPLDDRDEWFRYHHLFGELLRAQLERRAPTKADALHRRAASWYEEHDDLERAVRHHTAAGGGDAAYVHDLAATACDRLLMGGQYERARQLMGCFTDEQALHSPALCLTAALLGQYLTDSRVQRLSMQGLSMPVGDEPTPVGAASLRSWQAAVRASRAPDGVTRMLEDAELACSLEASVHSEWRLSCQAMRVMALYLLGRVRQALSLLAETVARGDLGDELPWWLGMRVLIAADQHDWRLAEDLDREIQAMPSAPLLVPTVLAHALVLGHRSDPAALAYVATSGRELVEVFRSTPWRRILGADVFAEVALRVGEDGEAERWTVEAEAALAHFPDAGVLRGRTKRLREALEQLRMADPLTAAERRVLDLLPTQLTAAQMAVRLFLTENTVKSHVSHIYRKLGVTTRTGAVESAGKLGLL